MTEVTGKNEKIEKLIGFSLKEQFGIWLLIIFIVISPALLTQLDWGFDFTQTGQIGDTIGGITAPLVNLLAAYLVYKSFEAQIRANTNQRHDHNEQMKEIRKEYDFNYIKSLFTLITEEYYSKYNDEQIELVSFTSDLESFYDPQSWRLSDFVGGRQRDDFIRDIINDQAVGYLAEIEGDLEKLLILLEELDRLNLDMGIDKYYKSQIEAMVKHMELWRLLNPDYLEFLEKKEILFPPQKEQYELVKSLALIVQKYGVKIHDFFDKKSI